MLPNGWNAIPLGKDKREKIVLELIEPLLDFIRQYL